MKKLTQEDIQKNRVETVNQFRVLSYLKKEMNTTSFKFYIYDRNTILVEDKLGEMLLVKYKESIKKIEYEDYKIENDKGLER